MKLISKILFVDWRHIQCGRVDWRTRMGETLGVANPPGPPVPLCAYPQRVPHGIRLVAQPASTTEPIKEWKGWDRTIFDEGRKNFDGLMWHPEFGYYIQTYDEKRITAQQFGWGCHCDQTMGQWWADILDLGPILPPDHVRSALRNIRLRRLD